MLHHDQLYKGNFIRKIGKTFILIFLLINSVIRGVGEMDVYRNNVNRFPAIPETPKTAKSETSEQLNLEYEERPYLIVDLRDKDEFNANHIVSGKFIYL